MDDQKRGVQVLHIGDGGHASKLFGVVDKTYADLAAEHASDVGVVLEADHIVHRSFAAGGGEAVGVGHDPAGHVAAVGTAEYTESIRIDEVELVECCIDDGDAVVVVGAAPAAA